MIYIIYIYILGHVLILVVTEKFYDHSPPFSVEVKNTWRYTFIPPTHLQAWCLTKQEMSWCGA
jgi:hypothetical protein